MRRCMALALFVGCSVSLNGQTPSAPTLIYLVRHAESGVANPISVLTDKGRARANDFAAAVREIRFTHILASHTERARQMVEPVARSAGLPIVQLPRPGSTVDGA